MSNLFWLTDERMERPRPFFPKIHGKPRMDGRRVLNGAILINRNGLGDFARSEVSCRDFRKAREAAADL